MGTSTKSPLEGIRVLDLGQITAGAATTQVFADFGADVVKVEWTDRFDSFRVWSQINPSEAGTADINNSAPFLEVNRNKRGIALDLKSGAGRRLFLRLAEHADLVVENFSRGVMGRLGIGFEQLREVNPRIILLSLSSQGESGPESSFVSFGSSLEAMGGLVAITGPDDDSPMWTGNNLNYPDQLVSYAAPSTAIAALRQRDRRDEAVHIDFCQRESVTYSAGEEILAASLSGVASKPQRNRLRHTDIQGVYPCRGDDEWVAITVDGDDEWRQVAEELGIDAPGWERQDTRVADHDLVDAKIAEATRSQKRRALAEALQARGVASAPVLRAREVLEDPQLEAIGGLTRVDGDDLAHRGVVAALERTPGRPLTRAPHLGGHTRAVLTDWLGMDDSELDALAEDGVIYDVASVVTA